LYAINWLAPALTESIMDDNEQSLEQRLENEIGSIDWPGLERHFARGVLVWIDPGLKLVDVAVSVVNDETESVALLMESGRIRRVTTEDALTWQQSKTTFRALVAAPWVLVQSVT
jgi:hypothetical protein